MKLHPLLSTRFKCIIDYPEPKNGFHYKSGEIINIQDEEHHSFITSYPFIFRELSWHEDRTIDEMLSVKFAEIVEYVGYDLVGDSLAVKGFNIANLNTPNPSFRSYQLNGRDYEPTQIKPTLSAYKKESNP